MTSSADQDQLASSEANWSGSTLFAKTGMSCLAREGLKLGANSFRLVKSHVQKGGKDNLTEFCLFVLRFYGQSTQLGHVKCGQFT